MSCVLISSAPLPMWQEAAAAGYPGRAGGRWVLRLGGAGAALVLGRDPGGAVGRGQRHRCLDGLPVSAREHRRARRSPARPALGAAGGQRPPGYSHINLDGTLVVATDRVATPGLTPEVDLWWSGKHHHHGGNFQVISAPISGLNPSQHASPGPQPPANPPAPPRSRCEKRSPAGSAHP